MMEEIPAYLLHRLVFELDRAADHLLQTHVGISYKRALFLLILADRGTITQHELATALGYSDPAVSTMLVELAKDGYVTTAKSPDHGRKRLVTITSKGDEAIAKGRRLLTVYLDRLMESAGVDAQHYQDLTEQIYKALVAEMKTEQA